MNEELDVEDDGSEIISPESDDPDDHEFLTQIIDGEEIDDESPNELKF